MYQACMRWFSAQGVGPWEGVMLALIGAVFMALVVVYHLQKHGLNDEEVDDHERADSRDPRLAR